MTCHQNPGPAIHIIPSYCHLSVSCRSLVDWCGSFGSCKPQIYIFFNVIAEARLISKNAALRMYCRRFIICHDINCTNNFILLDTTFTLENEYGKMIHLTITIIWATCLSLTFCHCRTGSYDKGHRLTLNGN